jgi:hypothetical protein
MGRFTCDYAHKKPYQALYLVKGNGYRKFTCGPHLQAGVKHVNNYGPPVIVEVLEDGDDLLAGV